MRSIRRSEIAARSTSAIARKSSAWATTWAWKFPALTILPVPSASDAKTNGLSVEALDSVVRMRQA